MNRSRVRVFKLLAALAAFGACAFGTCALEASAQDRPPSFWFQGTRLIFEHPVAMQGDIAVSTRDGGLRRFLDRLGATVSFQPQQRYIVIATADRRTIVFTLGDPAYTIGGVRAQAPFAPFADGNDVVLPFVALARALYVEPVADAGDTVLQPRVGALDVRTDGGRTTVTVHAAMPLVTTTNADAPDRVQLSFAGLGSSLAPSRRAAGTAVDAIDVAVGGTAKVPVTTITIAGVRGDDAPRRRRRLARRVRRRLRDARLSRSTRRPPRRRPPTRRPSWCRTSPRPRRRRSSRAAPP